MNREIYSFKGVPNIGSVLAEKLHEVGINTIEELIKAGSEIAFVRLRTNDPGVCINTLYALEGAILGIRWHYLSEQRKLELKTFFNK